MSWVAILWGWNRGFSKGGSIRGQKEFLRGHTKPRRGATKAIPSRWQSLKGGELVLSSEGPLSPVFPEAKSQGAVSPQDEGKAIVCFKE